MVLLMIMFRVAFFRPFKNGAGSFPTRLKFPAREAIMFQDGPIDDVILRPLKHYQDARGWLCELFRHDELDKDFHPVMAYISMTLPGIARGPHEHRDQADYFCFIGPSNFKLYIWDNRENSRTYRNRQSILVGSENPQAVVVPCGVVHAYKNVGGEPGIVFNAPNRLYRGPGRKEPVDEIRHEEHTSSVFSMW
jgi:dTDP-4-dehydrorhamnose 3,5-epimerase